MASIPEFWDDDINDPLQVESTWQKFVESINGEIVSKIIPSPSFNNADFLFPEARVVCELKELRTEFLKTDSAINEFTKLVERLISENPKWRPRLFGGMSRILLGLRGHLFG